jgi:hypothetical protein
VAPHAQRAGHKAVQLSEHPRHVLSHYAKRKRWDTSADKLLNALSGLIYITSRSGELLAFGRRNWDAFACKNSGQDAVSNNLLGRNLFDFIQGEEVRAVYKSSHATLLEDDQARISFEYRCDAPDRERRMLMSVSTVVCDGGETAILYQSQILDERMRVPLPILSAENYKRPYSIENRVSICSFCAKIAWPLAAGGARQDWISADEYYAEGGSSLVGLNFGICPECFEKSQNMWRQNPPR